MRLREDWPTAYFRDTGGDVRVHFSELLEATGVMHPIRLSGQRRAVAAFATHSGNKLVVQLVNYDYDRYTDRTAAVADLRVTFEGVTAVRATAFTPGTTDSVPLPMSVGDRNVSVTVPQIAPWIVVSLDVATAP